MITDFLLQPVIVAGSLVGIFSILILGLYFILIHGKNIIVYLISPFGETYKLVAKKRISPQTEKFDYGKRTYIVDLKKAAFFSGSKVFLFYKLDEVEPIYFSNLPNRNAKTFNLVAGKISVIREILRGLGERNQSEIYLYLGLGITIGFIVGVLAAPHLFPSITPTSIPPTGSGGTTVIKP